MKEKFIQAHMKAAYVYADLSYCVRRQVGCVIVEGDKIVSIGYNGTKPGDENVCELADGTTKPDVIHAEHNALDKLKYFAPNMVLFCTTAPCRGCAEMIVKSGVTAVFYDDAYNNIKGLDYLQSHGVYTRHITPEHNPEEI